MTENLKKFIIDNKSLISSGDIEALYDKANTERDPVYRRRAVRGDELTQLFTSSGIDVLSLPTVTAVPTRMFESSKEVEITIPAGITGINNGTFLNAAELVKVNLPSSLTRIGSIAFYGCYKLKSLIIPDNVVELGNYCFYGCDGLEEIHLPPKLKIIPEGCFGKCKSLTHIKIPDGVTEIGYYAFGEMGGDASIEIPPSVTTIYEGAFYHSWPTIFCQEGSAAHRYARGNNIKFRLMS